MNSLQSAILAFVERYCRADAGYSTSDIAGRIARQTGHENNRQHSALILLELRELEGRGLVRRMDDKKPIVWCRTE